MTKYFVESDGRLTGEVLVENPANPQQLAIVDVEQNLEHPCIDYVMHDGILIYSPSAIVVVPSRCSRRQGRLALLNAGKLDLVESTIASISDPVARSQAEIEYEADTWERGNPFLQSMWTSIGGTEQELDALFSIAVTL